MKNKYFLLWISGFTRDQSFLCTGLKLCCFKRKTNLLEWDYKKSSGSSSTIKWARTRARALVCVFVCVERWYAFDIGTFPIILRFDECFSLRGVGRTYQTVLMRCGKLVELSLLFSPT